MSALRNKIQKSMSAMREEISAILKEHKDDVISTVTVKHLYGGMRGLIGMACNSSYVDPIKGLHIRGIPISELTDKLPEEIFYLLASGELPNKEELKALQHELFAQTEQLGSSFLIL